MSIPSTTKTRIWASVLIVWITTAGVRAAGQSSQDNEISGAVTPVPVLQPGASGDELIVELVKQNELRNAQLQEYSAVRIYAVTNLEGKVHAKETVRMEYIAPDKKTFVKTAEEGSHLVRSLVLNRLIESETSAASGKEHHDSAITPANYTFTLLGQEEVGGHHCYVVAALPKREDKYLFEGKIWIDSRDFAIVRIAGHPAKRLSFWITRAEFVRRYEKIGGFWFSAEDETFVDVRFYGKKILTIEHHIDTVNGMKSAASVKQVQDFAWVSEKMKSK
jgi:hypothetical protein